jgi:hypothetical protein
MTELMGSEDGEPPYDRGKGHFGCSVAAMPVASFTARLSMWSRLIGSKKPGLHSPRRRSLHSTYLPGWRQLAITKR